MGKSYSLDLRQRLIDRVMGGQSRRSAAEDLAVSTSFAVKLAARHEETGSLEAATQGRPRGTGKLEPYRDFLIGRVKGTPDITMLELAAALEAQHGVAVDPASLSRFLLCKAGFSFKKKRCWQPNAIALTLPSSAASGSRSGCRGQLVCVDGDETCQCVRCPQCNPPSSRPGPWCRRRGGRSSEGGHRPT